MAVGVAIVGACGRMGSEVMRTVALQPDMKVAVAVEAPGHPLLGSSVGGAVLTAELEPALQGCDVVVDFSSCEAVPANVRAAVKAGRPFVCGVTGLDDATMAGLRDAAARVPVVYAANFSVGVAVLARLTAEAARLLGPGFDAEIVETHHRGKKDAPSGTARLLAETVRDARGGGDVRSGRDGAAGPKPAGEIGVSAVRTGDVVGEHVVVFGGAGERLELVHRTQSRAAFASGVVAAVRFVRGRTRGWFTLADVLDSGRRVP